MRGARERGRRGGDDRDREREEGSGRKDREGRTEKGRCLDHACCLSSTTLIYLPPLSNVDTHTAYTHIIHKIFNDCIKCMYST